MESSNTKRTKVSSAALGSRESRRKLWQVGAVAALTVFIASALYDYHQAGHFRFVAMVSQNSRTALSPQTNKPNQDSQCATVHVATHCNDVSQTRDLVSMLHTILAHRTSPLQFHLIVDESSERTLRLLFDTWELPNVTVHLYAGTSQNLANSAITTTKLVALLRSVLPTAIAKVIYATSRMRFLDDVAKLWHSLDESEKWIVGVVPDMETCLGSSQSHLYDIVVVNMAQPRSTNVSLGVLKPLPSSWCVSMIGRQPLDSQPQGVIWKDRFTGSMILENARRRVLDILDLNGDFFRTAFVCGGERVGLVPRLGDNTTDECAEFTFAVKTKRRIHLNFVGGLQSRMSSNDPYDISMATQLSVDRLTMLEKSASSWDGPIVAVVHASDSEARDLVTKIQQSEVLNSRQNIAYHVVYKRQFNPINLLRNVAVNQTKTPYVIVLDVDFAPTPSSYSILKRRLRELVEAGNDKLIPVIPTFQAFDSLVEPPKRKTELLQLIKEDKLDAYKLRKGFHEGHRRTDYPRWKVANESYVVTWKDPFEPYVIMPTKNIPLYPEELLERMKDKCAYNMQLHAMGYDLLILHDLYIVHFPHPLSQATNIYETYPGYKRCTYKFYDAYKKQIEKLYPGRRL